MNNQRCWTLAEAAAHLQITPDELLEHIDKLPIRAGVLRFNERIRILREPFLEGLASLTIEEDECVSEPPEFTGEDMANIAPNISELAPGKFRVRVRWKNPLTGSLENTIRHVDGTLRDALKLRDDLKALAERGLLTKSHGQPESKRHEETQLAQDCLRVVDLLDAFWAKREGKVRRRRGVRKSTLDTDRSRWKNHIGPEVNDWLVSEIQAVDVERLMERWERKTKPSGDLYSVKSVVHWLVLFRSFLKFAFRKTEQHEKFAWLQEIERPYEEPEVYDKDKLSPENVATLLRELQKEAPQHYLCSYLLFATGQRIGSVTALEWDDVDFDRQILTFNRSQVRGDTRKGNKTGKTIVIPLTEQLIELLKWHKDMLPTWRGEQARATDLLFPARQRKGTFKGAYGGYMSNSAIRAAWLKVCEKHSLPRITPHDGRRFFNTQVIESGQVSDEVLRAITAHSSSDMTNRYYRPSLKPKATAIALVEECLK